MRGIRRGRKASSVVVAIGLGLAVSTAASAGAEKVSETDWQLVMAAIGVLLTCFGMVVHVTTKIAVLTAAIDRFTLVIDRYEERINTLEVGHARLEALGEHSP